jgi:N-acetylmuramoyl-L-alanine amidase
VKLLHDPGHGGDNRGCAYHGLDETRWVLQLAHDLEAALAGFGVEQRLTRQEDITISYEQRAEDAWEWAGPRCLVLCHHVNAMVRQIAVGKDDAGVPVLQDVPDETVDGLMAFALAQDYRGLEVASAVMRAAPCGLLRRKTKSIPATSQDWTRHAYNVLRPYARRGMIAVLVEWGFATSPRDRAILQSPSSRPAICAAAAAGVSRALELIH